MLTPDSIFAENIEFGPEMYAHRIDRHQKEITDVNEILEEINISFSYDSSWIRSNKQNSWQHHLDISIDSSSCRVNISEFNIPEFHLPDFDSIFSSHDSIAKNFKFYSQYIPKIEYFDNKIKIDFDTDSIKSYEFEIYDFDMDSIMKSQFEMIDSMQKFNFNNFFNFSDSMVFRGIPRIDSYFKYYHGDDDIEMQMGELKKELENFREEMKEWQFEFKDGSSSRKREHEEKR
jgi:hypothetical protein